MKRKQLLLTTSMAATLASLSGCAQENDDWTSDQAAYYDTAVCVDQSGQRVPDERCDDDYYNGRIGGHGWYYIGRGGRVPYYGDTVTDPKLGFTGSTTADPTKVYSRAPTHLGTTRAVALSRGGFGSSSRGFGGGRS